MNFSKKNHKLVDQNELVTNVKKHDVNLQKNSTLYFQVGLILTLLATYGLFEMQFQTKLISIERPPVEIEKGIYVKYIPEPIPDLVAQKQIEPQRKPLLAINLTQVPNDTQLNVTNAIITEPISTSTPINHGDINTPKAAEELNKVFNMIGVEQVPIYPGCEKYTSRVDLKKCMSKKIGKLIGRKFNVDIAQDLGLSGKQRISVQFTIDKLGNVTDVIARAPHNRLEKEAVKVIYKIPKMIPGKQRDKNVEVVYSLPILFQVQ